MFLHLDTSPVFVLVIQIFRGIFVGLSIITITVLSMSRVPREKITQASAINNTVRQISGSFGLAVLSTILQNRQIYHLEHIAENINYASTPTNNMIHYLKNVYTHHGSISTLAHQQALTHVNGIAQKYAAIFAYDDAFFVLGIFSILCLLVSLMLKSSAFKK